LQQDSITTYTVFSLIGQKLLQIRLGSKSKLCVLWQTSEQTRCPSHWSWNSIKAL